MGNRIRTWLETLGASRENNHPSTSMHVKITVGNRTITATMEDNAAAQDFLSRLPLEVTLNDYNNITENFLSVACTDYGRSDPWLCACAR